jgi:hypothetical protein
MSLLEAPTKAMTVGWYTLGGLRAAAIYRPLWSGIESERERLQTTVKYGTYGC